MTSELAGALRERVAIERRLPDRDRWAGARGGWAYDGAAWVSVTPVVAGDEGSADPRAARARWRVVMRKREGIGGTSRFVWRGRFLSVRSILSDPRDPSHMIVTCEEAR
jgi:head-tail adaptor